MRVNYKQMYLMALAERRALLEKLEPRTTLPEDFNQKGWDETIAKLETLLSLLKELRELKGRRLTPRFFQGIYTMSVGKIRDAERLLERWKAETTEKDFEAEYIRLAAENQKLRAQLEAATSGQADKQ